MKFKQLCFRIKLPVAQLVERRFVVDKHFTVGLWFKSRRGDFFYFFIFFIFLKIKNI